ncbi:PEP-CTERM sorting domain-containing protein [Roseateles sp. P5_E11]
MSQYLPRRSLRSLARGTLIASLLAAGLTQAASAASATDAWDVSQGSAVTQFIANPALPGNGPGMFGGDAGENSPFSGERFNTIFPDLLPTGTVHVIEWATPAPITLLGWQLEAAADGGNGARSFAHFTLSAEIGGAWVAVSSVDTLALYVDQHLQLGDSFAPVTASHFRAEFTQATSFFGASGPRVVELDAITAAVPEPGTWALMLGGLAALARRRR